MVWLVNGLRELVFRSARFAVISTSFSVSGPASYSHRQMSAQSHTSHHQNMLLPPSLTHRSFVNASGKTHAFGLLDNPSLAPGEACLDISSAGLVPALCTFCLEPFSILAVE